MQNRLRFSAYVCRATVRCRDNLRSHTSDFATSPNHSSSTKAQHVHQTPEVMRRYPSSARNSDPGNPSLYPGHYPGLRWGGDTIVKFIFFGFAQMAKSIFLLSFSCTFVENKVQYTYLLTNESSILDMSILRYAWPTVKVSQYTLTHIFCVYSAHVSSIICYDEIISAKTSKSTIFFV